MFTITLAFANVRHSRFSLEDVSDSMRTMWQNHGYDSAFAAAGVIGRRPEFCISDPRRIKIVGLECSGHAGWLVCVECTDMIYTPKTHISKRKFRCRECR
eukprot:m.90527 g.90527  ORF g.90527 m.90527 type:complete len:100 (+) comp20131_c0_seq2:5320-5619(+)